jgi:Mrp family chromosome partitioning ATPase/predicted Fe-Mo cluster-binding NifX family protein
MSTSCEHSDPGDDGAIKEKLAKIGHTFVVLSGKGGVGKSTVAVNLALSLAARGFRTGMLDTDIHGPSVPKLLGLSSQRLSVSNDGIVPLDYSGNLKVVSIGLLLDGDDKAVIWRGPMKANVIRQFFGDVVWGNLDYLVVDSPPGTGDEPLSVAQLLDKDTSSAIIVTTPQQVATIDVEKSITFCRQLGLPISGIIENMSGFVCPHCGQEAEIFSSGGGRRLADRFGVPFLGSIPLDPDIVRSGDGELPFVESYSTTKTAQKFQEIVEHLTLMHPGGIQAGSPCEAACGCSDHSGTLTPVGDQAGYIPIPNKEVAMRFAVPTNDKKLCAHFGHCEAFALIDTDGAGKLGDETYVIPPPHEPGLLPPWLAQQGVNCVIAGGMGARAQQLFVQAGVRVITGAQGEYPREVVENYLKGSLVTGANTCDH